MSHNLEFRNGSYSTVSAKEVPWHNLGTVLDHKMTSEEAIRLARLDFTVEKGPLYVKYLNEINNQRGKEYKANFGTYRTDTGFVLGIVGSDYTVIQNTEVFNFFDDIVDKDEAIFETAGVLGQGQVIFVTAKLPEDINVRGDLIKQYLLLSTSHDGTGAINILFTPTRVVCQNTLNLALSVKTRNKVKIKHTKNANERIIQAKDILGISRKYKETLKQNMEHLVSIKMDTDTTRYAINKVFLSPEEESSLVKLGTLDAKRSKDISTRKSNHIENVLNYIEYGVGQNTEATYHTAFGVLQGVVSFYHNAKDWKTSEDEMINILTGNVRMVQQKTYDTLIELNEM